jgi:hypothetical protein
MAAHMTGTTGSHQSVRNIRAEVRTPRKKKSRYFMMILDYLAN